MQHLARGRVRVRVGVRVRVRVSVRVRVRDRIRVRVRVRVRGPRRAWVSLLAPTGPAWVKARARAMG